MHEEKSAKRHNQELTNNLSDHIESNYIEAN